MTTRLSIQLTLLALLLLTGAAQAAESLSVLLQKGIFAEETEGNLDAAIKIYEGILKETEANRSLAAQAQYRLGVCQSKKGKKEEAESAFRRIVERFSDQTNLIAKTRERLSELGKPFSTPVIRQVWGSAGDAEGSISPDGRWYAFVDWDTGNLAIRDLKSATNRALTHKGDWSSSSEFALYPRFSRDGKLVAYHWCNREGTFELRLVSVEKPQPRTVVQTLGVDQPVEWSPDGSQLLTTLHDLKLKEAVLALVAVADGRVRPLKTNSPPVASQFRFGPDGRSLVFSREPSLAADQHDIYMMDLASASEVPLVQHPANDFVVGWAPNGRNLLFVSDRRGSKDLWSVEVADGKANGEPILLRPNLGEVSALGITVDGAFYYGVSSGGVGMARAAVDFTTGKVLSPPQLIPRPAGHSLLRMNLSPDGRQLAFYVSQRPSYFHPVLFLMNLETQQTRKVQAWNSDDLVDIPFWLPDSRSLLHRATRKDGRKDLSFVDTQTGAITPITLVDKSPTPVGIPLVLKEDVITYVRQDPKQKNYWLVRRTLKDGRETESALIKEPDSDAFYDFHIDVEEKAVLYTKDPTKPSADRPCVAMRYDWATDKTVEWLRATNRIQIALGPKAGQAAIVFTQPNREVEVSFFRFNKQRAERVWTAAPAGITRLFRWTADGRHLLGVDKGRQWWALSTENGEARKTELSTPKLLQLMSIHPDNQQIFFTMSEPSVNEVWVMENFLPPLAAAK